jgi:hypothetical protein
MHLNTLIREIIKLEALQGVLAHINLLLTRTYCSRNRPAPFSDSENILPLIKNTKFHNQTEHLEAICIFLDGRPEDRKS